MRYIVCAIVAIIFFSCKKDHSTVKQEGVYFYLADSLIAGSGAKIVIDGKDIGTIKSISSVDPGPMGKNSITTQLEPGTYSYTIYATNGRILSGSCNVKADEFTPIRIASENSVIMFYFSDWQSRALNGGVSIYLSHPFGGMYLGSLAKTYNTQKGPIYPASIMPDSAAFPFAVAPDKDLTFCITQSGIIWNGTIHTADIGKIKYVDLSQRDQGGIWSRVADCPDGGIIPELWHNYRQSYFMDLSSNNIVYLRLANTGLAKLTIQVERDQNWIWYNAGGGSTNNPIQYTINPGDTVSVPIRPRTAPNKGDNTGHITITPLNTANQNPEVIEVYRYEQQGSTTGGTTTGSTTGSGSTGKLAFYIKSPHTLYPLMASVRINNGDFIGKTYIEKSCTALNPDCNTDGVYYLSVPANTDLQYSIYWPNNGNYLPVMKDGIVSVNTGECKVIKLTNDMLCNQNDVSEDACVLFYHKMPYYSGQNIKVYVDGEYKGNVNYSNFDLAKTDCNYPGQLTLSITPTYVAKLVEFKSDDGAYSKMYLGKFNLTPGICNPVLVGLDKPSVTTTGTTTTTGSTTGSTTTTGSTSGSSTGSSSSTSTTGGTTGGGSVNCQWTNSNLGLTIKYGTRCGSKNSIDISVKNNYADYMKVFVAFQKQDGTWLSWEADGTFNTGMQSGESRNWYTCNGSGNYKVIAIPASQYITNKCTLPPVN